MKLFLAAFGVLVAVQVTVADAYRPFTVYQGGRGFAVGEGYQSDRDFYAPIAVIDGENQEPDEQHPYFPAEPIIDFDGIISKLFRRIKASEKVPEIPIIEDTQTDKDVPAVKQVPVIEEVPVAGSALDAGKAPVPEEATVVQEDPAEAESPTPQEDTSSKDSQDVPAIE